MVIVNLRDTTFEAHRDEKPLDAFVNAVNFYIRPPRFAQVIRKRLELVLEKLPAEMERRHSFSVAGGQKISVPASRLGDFMLGIYKSLFEQKSIQVASALEALVAKDARRALGMFADLIVSPHIPVEQMTVAGVGDESAIQESRIIRALMRGRYRYFNNASKYIFNVLKADVTHRRPSNFIYADILDFLIRNRKKKIDFSAEGYALVSTIVARMAQIGYDEEDTFNTVKELVTIGLIEPESLIVETLSENEAIRVHASGFIHLRYFTNRLEYVAGVTPVMAFSSRSTAESVASLWSGRIVGSDIGLGVKRKLAEKMAKYFRQEYERRCNRHAFYRDLGFGGRYLVHTLENVSNWKPSPAGRQ